MIFNALHGGMSGKEFEIEKVERRASWVIRGQTTKSPKLHYKFR